jgi:glycosyltransferase involved in cell wall biosynthesis
MSAALKAVVLTHGFFPRIGGIERLVASVYPLLQRQGMDVHIVTRRLPGTLSYEVFDGMPVYRLPSPKPKPLASLLFTLAAIPLILRLKPDLIHAHELISPTTTALLARRFLAIQDRRPCPVVATVHSSGPMGDVMRMQNRPLGNLRLKYLCRAIDRFVVISREIDGQLAARGVPVHKRCVIPNGVDVKQFSPVAGEARKALRLQLGLPVETDLAVFAGRLAREKRLDQLLSIWPAVRACCPAARLLVLGSGPEEPALKRLAQELGLGESVHWAGAQSQVAPYLQAADLFVLPSSAEGLSVALLEALACGLPVVATSVGGAPDVIAHGENGWLIPAENREALQEAILALLGHLPLRREMGCKARQHILANYSLEGIATRLGVLYQEMARKGGPQ